MGWVVDWVFFGLVDLGWDLIVLEGGFRLEKQSIQEEYLGGLNRWCISIMLGTVAYDWILFGTF